MTTTPGIGDLVRITTNIATSHFGETGQVAGATSLSVMVEFASGRHQMFSREEVELVATESDFVIFRKSDLPRVISKGTLIETERDASGVSWSFGTNSEEAPDETDPLHFIAVIDYFKRSGLPLHSEVAND